MLSKGKPSDVGATLESPLPLQAIQFFKQPSIHDDAFERLARQNQATHALIREATFAIYPSTHSNQFGKFAMEIQSISVSGVQDGYTIALKFTNMNTDLPGCCHIGLLDKKSNQCQEFMVLPKAHGRDFLVEQFNVDDKQWQVKIGVVKTPKEYVSLPWKFNDPIGLSQPASEFIYHCDQDTKWSRVAAEERSLSPVSLR